MNASSPLMPIEMLLVEDNPGDILLTQQGLSQLTLKTHLNVVRDGEEALQYLRKQGIYSDAVTPEMIILDLNLPRLDGREVLNEIKTDPNLQHIPVVILTSSEADSDVLESYRLHANCYVVKPSDYEQYMEAVKTIHGFWLKAVKLPVIIKH